MATRFLAGESSGSIAESFATRRTCIDRILRQDGIAARGCAKPINHDAFDEWTPEASYWAGFLFADGCVSDRRTSLAVVVCVAESDVDHLLKFKQFLGSSHAVSTTSGSGYKSGSRHYQFGFSSQQIGERLQAAGIVKGRGPVLDPFLATSRDFWRGVIDGDGCVGVRKPGRGTKPVPSLELVGHADQLVQFSDYVKRLHPSAAAIVHPHKGIHRVRLSGLGSAVVAKELYRPGDVALDRKAAVATQVAAWELTAPVVNRCTTPGCTGEYKAKGLCVRCYARAKYPNRREWYAAKYAARRSA